MNEPLPRVAEFLDAQAAAGGPFALLGLTPREVTPARIEAALQRQLDRVDEHPAAHSPDADDVRLALHSAAAQLLDPNVRRELVRIASAEAYATSDEPAPLLPPLPDSERGDDRVDLLESDREREPIEVATPVAPASERPGARANRAGDFLSQGQWSGPSASGGDGEWLADRRTKRSGARVLLISAAALLLLLGVVVVIIVMTSATSTAPPVPVAGTPPQQPDLAPAPSPADASIEAAEAAMPGGPAVRSKFIEAGKCIRDLRKLALTAKTNPSQASAAMGGLAASLADWWCQADEPVRRAGVDAMVELIFALGSDDKAAGEAVGVLREWSALIRRPAGEMPPALLWRATWAVGVLTRLSIEGDLPRPAAARVSEAMTEALGAGRSAELASFNAGAALALRACAPHLAQTAGKNDSGADAAAKSVADSREITGLFVVCARTLAGPDLNAGERFLVDAVERLLLEGAEPNESAAVNAAVSDLLAAIKWRKDGPARTRLMDWFRDERMSTPDLYLVTSVLATKSAADGVDATMVLSIGATPDDRIRVGADYARVWGFANADATRSTLSELTQAASSAIQTGPGSDASPGDVLAATAQLARLSDAARVLWLGDPTQASAIVRDTPALLSFSGGQFVPGSSAPSGPGSGKLLSRGPGAGSGQTSGPVGSQPGSDGAWAESFLRAERNIPLRIERLNRAKEELPRPVGRVNAGVLVENALLGSPSSVRLAAQQQVAAFSDEPAVVEALIEQLPSAPKITSVSMMIEGVAGAGLPKPSSADWELSARRELIAKLLAMLAAGSSQARVEAMSTLIADTYARAAAPAGLKPDASSAERAAAGVRGHWERWRLEAGAIVQVPPGLASPVQVERRLLSRRAVATGPVQLFAAEQMSVAELMACVVASERPQSAQKIVGVIEELTRSRRSAAHVFDQIHAGELAVLKLWLIRFGKEDLR